MRPFRRMADERGELCMKTSLRLVFTLSLLLFSLALAVRPALAASGDAEVLRPEAPRFIRQVAASGDSLYAYMTDGSVGVWDAREDTQRVFCELPTPPDVDAAQYDRLSAEERRALDASVSFLAEGGDALYGFNVHSGIIGRVTPDGVKWMEGTLDVSPFWGDGAYPRAIFKACVVGDALYALADYGTDAPELPCNARLVRCELSGGKASVLPMTGIQAFCRYAPGELLLMRWAADEAGGLRRVLSVLDIASQRMEDLPLRLPGQEETIGGLACDGARGCIYYATAGEVFVSRAGAPFAPCAYLPGDIMIESWPGWVLPDGRYAVQTDGVCVRVPKESLPEENVLRLSGVGADAAHAAFLSEHPEARALVNANRVSAATVAEHVRQGDSRYDIYLLYADSEYRALAEKGYLQPLIDAGTLAADVADMYPAVQAALTDGAGELVAYPYFMDVERWSVNRALWARYFGDEPLPQTWAAFLSAMLRFARNDAAREDGVAFLYGYDETAMAEDIVDAYIACRGAQGGPLRLDDPALREVLAAYEQVRDDARAHAGDAVLPDESGGAQPMNVVFFRSSGRPFLTNTESTEYQSVFQDIAPPSFAQEGDGVVQGHLYVLVVNPHSANKELAYRYLETVGRLESDPLRYYALHPDAMEPYVDPHYAGLEAQIRAFGAELRGDLQRAEAAGDLDEAARLQALIDRGELALAEGDRNKWLISSGSIAAYRAYAPTIDFRLDNPYFSSGDGGGGTKQVRALCERYAQGQLARDGFLRELSRVLEMIYLEGR